MNPYCFQQEILLMTNTSFARKQWCIKEDLKEYKQLLIVDQLEEACWNGLLDEMLPGIVEEACNDKHLFMWDIKHQEDCVAIELGQYPEDIQVVYSIDPDNFLGIKNYN